MGLGASGIALAGWFFFFSVNEYKFLWGLLSVVEFLVGYLIYRLHMHIFMMNGMIIIKTLNGVVC